MATATKDVERIVRRMLKEEQEETLNAIQELSTLLTEQVIPRLSDDEGEESDSAQDEEQDEEQDDMVTMSALDNERPAKRGRKPSPNGHDEDEDADLPEPEVPEAVTEAFADLYKALSPEQASALAAFFATVDSELGDAGNEEPDEEPSEEMDDEGNEEAGARG